MVDYIYSIFSTLAVGVLGYLLKDKLKQIKELKREKQEIQNERQTALQDGVLALLRVKLIEYHNRYTSEEQISTYGYENWVLMYDAYKSLGGNGMITKMHEEIQRIHFK